MVEILTLIKSKLEAISDKIWLENVKDKSKPPFGTFRLSNSTDSQNDSRADIVYILEIDVYDVKKDTTALENLVSDLDDALNRNKGMADSFHYKIIRLSRSMVPEPDEFLRRRQLRYEIHIFKTR